MTKTFAAHLADARNAKTAADLYAAVKAMGEKLQRNASKVALMHYKHGWAAEAQHWSEKMIGWRKLYKEALAIWQEKSLTLSRDEVIKILTEAHS